MADKLEARDLQDAGNIHAPLAPVFIVGLPRSGTTLLYQLLLNYFEWSYFTRWCDLFYRAPVMAYRVQRALFPEPKEFEYASDYGRFQNVSLLSRAWSPVEGHAIWRRWFPPSLDDALRGDLGPMIKTEIRAVIEGFSETAGKPFLNKNGVHSMRVSALSDIFPEAFFIVLQRQSEYVAQSLYIARIRRTKQQRRNDWWGTKPKEYERLKDLDPLMQAVGQTRAIEAAISKQLAGNIRHLEIDYKDACEQPAKIMNRIYESCVTYGMRLRKKSHVDPKPFPLQNQRKVSEKEFDTIKGLLREDFVDSSFAAFVPSGVGPSS
jgi:Sulfotransferase family